MCVCVCVCVCVCAGMCYDSPVKQFVDAVWPPYLFPLLCTVLLVCSLLGAGSSEGDRTTQEEREACSFTLCMWHRV